MYSNFASSLIISGEMTISDVLGNNCGFAFTVTVSDFTKLEEVLQVTIGKNHYMLLLR